MRPVIFLFKSLTPNPGKMLNFAINIIRLRENKASALIVDLRNSTQITRCISSNDKFEDYINFVMGFKKIYFEFVDSNLLSDVSACNDTGDGIICVFWDEKHAITCMKAMIQINDYFVANLDQQNRELDTEVKLSYGFALHTAACLVYRTNYMLNNSYHEKDFIYGILANTVARLEHVNKIFKDSKIVVSGNFKKNFSAQLQRSNKQANNLFIQNRKDVRRISARIEISDGKPEGHFIYLLNDTFCEAANILF